ncbi:hypothetical protein [Paraglaciecola sp. 20A4]|uniref:hypothetical protein n=1 Tax=Paraglaciecola sp. 20A4 TaxID=2687288 RepID=UPI00140D27C2|nr:hypothetical protein [Paraglaciecola sp. 20A4]
MKIYNRLILFTLLCFSITCYTVKANAAMISFSSTYSDDWQFSFPLNEKVEKINGLLQIDPLLIDMDPTIKRGEFSGYLGLASEFFIDGNQISLSGKDFTLRIFDNSGCDCFFLDIALDMKIAGVDVYSMLFNIQQEDGQLFTGTSLDDLYGFNLANEEPRFISASLDFEDETAQYQNFLGRGTFESFIISDTRLNIVNSPYSSFIFLSAMTYLLIRRSATVIHNKLRCFFNLKKLGIIYP